MWMVNGAGRLLLLLALVLPFAGCGTEQEYARGLVETYDRAKATGTAMDMKSVAAALAAFEIDNGEFPRARDMAALGQALCPDYLLRPVERDKWGRPFRYDGRGSGYRLLSLGEDGREGTDDDLVLEDGRLTRVPEGFAPPF